ncbi:MAG: glycine zipper domain-containing protein [Planctomycetota bacterium]
MSAISKITSRPAIQIRASIAAALLLGCTANSAQAQFGNPYSPYPPRTQQTRGTVVGGVAGAAIGAAIGDNNNEAGAGAAIGGLIGAVAGRVMGNAADQERAYRQQTRANFSHRGYASNPQAGVYSTPVPTQVAAPTQVVRQVPQTSVSVPDVVNMVRSGLSDAVVVNQIQQRGVTHSLQVADIISLHQAGVSEHVITSMQRATVGQPVTATAATTVQPAAPPVYVTPRPVIIQERYFVPQHGRPIYRRGPGSTFHYRF